MKKKQIKEGVCKADDFCKFENAKVHPELQAYFAYSLTKAALRLRMVLDEKLKPFNIIAPQLGMLRLIHNFGPISQSELGHGMGIDKATMVKFVDSMEKDKYLVRKGCEKDRRIKYLHLTPVGKKTLEKCTRLRQEVEHEFLTPLTAAERAVLEKALPKLVR